EGAARHCHRVSRAALLDRSLEGVLVFKIFTFGHYADLSGILAASGNGWWLVAVLLLMPVNWMLEALKWKMLVVVVSEISFGNAVKAVLSGITTGFSTPNRLGEFLGRVASLHVDDRRPGFTLSMLNSLSQNIVMALAGIPAAIVFFTCQSGSTSFNWHLYLVLVVSCLVLLLLFYFSLPGISRWLQIQKPASKMLVYTDCLSGFSLLGLIRVMVVTFFRYTVFCFQFYCMLLCFGVRPEPLQALIAIPASYLFVTFTPSWAVSEAAIRGSYAVVFVGGFVSGHDLPIMLAGISLWMLNFVLPMFAGSVLLSAATKRADA
ncbi:MAG TPA: lysylphosphatidylglycerol synthase domain-containing protein, partial [Paludibacter sp.]|nr:lysylphosphatidylglycerol synthase domain-containing protein [Paludibacter sp.]